MWRTVLKLTVYCLLLTALAVTLSACNPDTESGLQGQLLFQDRPLGKAQVEIYLRADKDRSTQPFAVANTDLEGRYRVQLPAGSYFVIGKQRSVTEDNRTRMLMAESPGNPHQVDKGLTTITPFNLREMGRQGGLVADADTGLSGVITRNDQPVARAYVYLYTQTESGLMGPSYGEAVQTGDDGRFQIDLPAGRYYLVARKRQAGGRSGELQPGDLNSAYPANPVAVKQGERLELDGFILEEIDPDTLEQRQQQGTFTATETQLSGAILDQDGLPVSGVHVFAYLDSRMVGKPAHISAPSADDGRFVLNLADGGTYFIGARSAYGGPLEPGEWVGTYNGRTDHGLEIASGKQQTVGNITVKEVW